MSVVLVALGAAALAQATVYVDFRASGRGDGASPATALRTIGEGVAAAAEGATVVVAGGPYVNERLPIVFARRDVTLRGPADRSAHIMAHTRSLGEAPVLSIVADGVTVERMAVSCHRGPVPPRVAPGDGSGISVDGWQNVDGTGRIESFTLTGNRVTGCGAGIRTRFASGVVSGNLIGEPRPQFVGNHVGAEFGGGLPGDGTWIRFFDNRLVGNQFFGAGFSGDPMVQGPPAVDLPPGAGGELTVEVYGNDASDNDFLGLALNPYWSPFSSVANGHTVLRADVHDNVARGNGGYGLCVHAAVGAFSLEDLCSAGSFESSITLAGNDFSGNGRNRIIHSFTAVLKSIDQIDACYFSHSSIDAIDDGDGGADFGFDYDVPADDRLTITRAPDGDTVTIAGARQITSP